MSKGTEQPPWDAREAFHRSAMAVYANLGALLAIIWRDRDLRVTLRVFDEHVVPYSAPDTGDPELVADLKHATVRLRSSLAAAEEIRGTHRQATRAFGKHGGSFGGVSTTSHHDALIAAANLVLDADEDPVLRQQVLKEGIDPAAWARLKENLENEFKLAQIEPPVSNDSKTRPLDVLTIFKEMDFMWLSIAEGVGDGADEAYDALFGPENFHAQLLALARRIDELKERFRGDVHKIADFAVTSGHEAAAIFAGRIAQFARARRRWIPEHRRELQRAEADGGRDKILRAQYELREGIRGFAKFVTPAFQGWDEHRAWIRRSIEMETQNGRTDAANPRGHETGGPILVVGQLPAMVLVTLLEGGPMNKVDVLALAGVRSSDRLRLKNLLTPKGDLGARKLIHSERKKVALTDEGRVEASLQQARGTKSLRSTKS